MAQTWSRLHWESHTLHCHITPAGGITQHSRQRNQKNKHAVVTQKKTDFTPSIFQDGVCIFGSVRLWSIASLRLESSVWWRRRDKRGSTWHFQRCRLAANMSALVSSGRRAITAAVICLIKDDGAV